MPLVRISLIEGTSEDRRRKAIAAVTDAVVETLDAPREAVRVLIDELPAANWGVAGQSFKDRQADQS